MTLLSLARQEWLGDFPELWFFEKDAKDAQKRFKDELRAFEFEVKARNSKLPVAYIHQMPSKVPNSIAI